jgi:hypothetical protein
MPFQPNRPSGVRFVLSIAPLLIVSLHLAQDPMTSTESQNTSTMSDFPLRLYSIKDDTGMSSLCGKHFGICSREMVISIAKVGNTASAANARG